jgi:crotonobetainyl-CoA:carnitine CoA-transferase CaiB-like acyl-CoA transferase
MAPLDGVVVLDLTRVLAGPYCTMTLGDLGATVWKIEHPGGGDETRSWAPPQVDGESTYFLSVNRNKHSVAIDLKHPDGARLARELAAIADVLVANFLPRSLERFGLDYASLSAGNPRLIHCTISGYGAHGSRAEQAGYDFVIQGESGLMSITGEPDGEPMKVGVAICDIVSGANASQAILAALLARERDGRGQSIDISLFDGALAALSHIPAGTLNGAGDAQRYGNAHASIVPYQTFRTADGSIVLACGNDRQFVELCERVLLRPELARDPRFATNQARVAHRGEIVTLIAGILEQQPSRSVLEALGAANVPAGPIRSVREALATNEVREHALIAHFDHVLAGGIDVVGSPLRLNGTPAAMRLPPPALGQHTRQVLAGALGLTQSALGELERTGAIGRSLRG